MKKGRAMRETAIALGANLGQEVEQLRQAIASFQAHPAVTGRVKCSPFYETAPVDCPEGSPRYVNGVVVFHFSGEPEVLLRLCKQLEVLAGRSASAPEENLPRPLDCDILYFGQEVRKTAVLTLPHPRMKERRFVLEPLSTLRPDFILPEEKRTVAELLAELDSGEPPLRRIFSSEL